jgi:hypothetical protein
VPFGEYTLAVEAPGFQKAEVSAFSLNVDQAARVNGGSPIARPGETIVAAHRPALGRGSREGTESL